MLSEVHGHGQVILNPSHVRDEHANINCNRLLSKSCSHSAIIRFQQRADSFRFMMTMFFGFTGIFGEDDRGAQTDGDYFVNLIQFRLKTCIMLHIFFKLTMFLK